MEFMGSSHTVRTGDGTRLHVVEWTPDPTVTERTEVLLVHGLASNAYVWEGVGRRLAAQGHRTVAVDQRGHGRSDKPETGYDFGTLIEDLRTLLVRLGLDRPLVAGQSWGGNVVLELGWRHPAAVRGIICVDGGIIELADWFPTWEACVAALTPPRLDHLTPAELEARMRAWSPELPDRAIAAALACFRVREDGRVEPRLARDRHLEIVRSLWEHRPSTRYATLETPTMLVLADTGDKARTAAKRRAEAHARAVTPRLQSHWFSPAHHDVHSQHPDRVAELFAAAVRDGFFG
jgi:pimeloyl-ACP methyl ester carboxylesterase